MISTSQPSSMPSFQKPATSTQLSVPDGPNFTARERLALLSKVERLSGCIGSCERIHQTAVPLNYARHSLRALTLWLFTLPFCLVSSLKLLTGPVLFLVSWLLFGVYEIGYSIEDPFQGTLRLSVLCDSIRRDVLGDEIIRGTAFEPDVTENATTHKEGIEEGNDEGYELTPLPVARDNDVLKPANKTAEFVVEEVLAAIESLPKSAANITSINGAPNVTRITVDLMAP